MMIWSTGLLLSETDPLIGATDRALEHGIGLFETLRTWGGSPVLLSRHLQRLRRSAEALGVPLDPGDLPDHRSITELLSSNGGLTEGVVRLTASGGYDGQGRARVWMRVRPVPPPFRSSGAVLVLGGYGLSWYDILARHKTLNYWSKRIAHQGALSAGADEALLGTHDGRIWEGSRTNLFLVRDRALITPSLDGPVVPGIMRGLVIELAQDLGLTVIEQDVRAADVDNADEVFLTNAVRGIVPAGETPGGRLDMPGPVTQRLLREVDRWLYAKHTKGNNRK